MGTRTSKYHSSRSRSDGGVPSDIPDPDSELVRCAIEAMKLPFLICEVRPMRDDTADQFIVLYANPAAGELAGAEPMNLVGQSPFAFLSRDTAEPVRKRLLHVVASGRAGSIPEVPFAAGHTGSMHVFPLGRGSKTAKRWGLLLQDVTAEHKEIGKPESVAVAQTAKLVEASHQELQHRERTDSMGTLVAGLGHDLNNLLLPVGAHLAALEAKLKDDAALIHVKAIGQAAQYLYQLNENMRLVALDPDRSDDAHGVTNVCAWWSHLQTLFERAIPASVNLSVEFPDDLPALGVSAHRLSQAVLNLLMNAGGAVKQRGRIRLWAEAGDDRAFVRLGVTDNGRGMTKNVLRHAMDPFFTTKRRGRGTGLGLSLVKGIVHSVGGSLEISSQPKSGTTVLLNLPVATDEALASAVRSGSAPAAVVVISDQRIRSCFETFLKSSGMRIVAEEKGQPADLAVLVIEPGARAQQMARDVRAVNPNCQIVLYGEASSEWRALGATIVDHQAGLSAIREALLTARAETERPR